MRSLVALLLLLVTVPLPAGNVPAPPPLAPQIFCWFEARYFRSFTAGLVDYCRAHLAYRPGALECYYLADQVCWTFAPDKGEWTQVRFSQPPLVFPCPYAPEPPVCPRLAGL